MHKCIPIITMYDYYIPTGLHMRFIDVYQFIIAEIPLNRRTEKNCADAR